MADYHILLLGPPGAGKGTQAKRLCAEYDLDHVSTGDALRANKDMETAYGTPRSFMEAGELVPDEVVNEVLAAALEDADGYVLDGYPRNLEQVEFLDDATDLDYVFFLDVEGHASEPAVKTALAEAAERANSHRVLGSFPRAASPPRPGARGA